MYKRRRRSLQHHEIVPEKHVIVQYEKKEHFPTMTEVTSNDCAHLNKCDDRDSGYEICTNCGLVLEQLYEVDYNHSQHIAPYNEITISTNSKQVLNKKCLITQFFTDISHYSFISKQIFNLSMTYFELIKQQSKEMKKKFTDVQLAAYALYTVLKEEGIPRTPSEIEAVTGVNTSYLWLIQHELPDKLNVSNPTSYVSRYCTILGFEFCEISKIKTIVGNMYGMGDIRSQTLVAAIIHLYYKQHKQNKTTSISKLTLKQICGVCNVSTHTTRKAIQRIKLSFKKICVLYS